MEASEIRSGSLADWAAKLGVVLGAPSVRATLGRRDVLLAAAFFLAGLWLFTRHNDFPGFYHPDEPRKAEQILEGFFNFNHPLLLLQTARLIGAVRQTGPDRQAITEDGRLASAIFAAGAVAAVVLLIAHLGGSVAAGAAGLLVLSNSQVFDLAHYMKEDPALAFGVCAFFLALVRYGLRPTAAGIAFAGAAAALAVSGKYIGAFVLPFAVWAIARCGRSSWRDAGIFSAALAVVLLAVNFPMLAQPGELRESMGREIDYVVHGNRGLSRTVPHGVYGRIFRDSINPAVWALLALFYAGLLARRRSVHPVLWMVAVFPVAYMVFLSFSPKTHHRYFLPDTVLFCALAALGAAPLGQRGAAAVRTALLAVAIALSAWQTVRIDRAFRKDTRSQLIDYVRANLPPDAVILQDRRVGLPDENDPRQGRWDVRIEQRVITKLFAADLGTIEELRARGIRHVAVCDAAYGRFLRKDLVQREEGRKEYERRRAFYTQLFSEGTLMWQCPGGELQYLQPSLKLYHLAPAAERPGG